MKTRKANKNHRCDKCNRTIKKGTIYEYVKIYIPEDGKLYTYENKECGKCINDRPKRNYKKEQSQIRGNARKIKCPDANFKLVWQGGWCGESPDGGDVNYECHACNLRCGTNQN